MRLRKPYAGKYLAQSCLKQGFASLAILNHGGGFDTISIFRKFLECTERGAYEKMRIVESSHAVST